MSVVCVVGFLSTGFFVSLLYVACSLAELSSQINKENSSPLECGLDPYSSARVPFSIRFLVLAVIFLVLDLEIALLVASPLSVEFISSEATTSCILVLIILSVGTAYEWGEGSLNWA